MIALSLPEGCESGRRDSASGRRSGLGEARNRRFPVPFFGPGPAPASIEAALAAHAAKLDVERLPDPDVAPPADPALPALLLAVGRETGRQILLNNPSN